MVTEGKRSIAERGANRGAALACAGAVATALGGCTLITDSFLTNDFSGDPFPINVDTTSGAIMVGMGGAGIADRPAVLDLLSPFTLIDPRTNADPTLSYVDLTLLGLRADGTLTLPRARFPEAQLLSLHPCALPDGADPASPPPCVVGSPADPRPFEALIGADVVAGDAVRLRLGDDQIFVLPDIGGNDRGRTLDCDAVFDSPYRGGGTLVISDTELPFGNRRITLHACLGPDPDPDPRSPLDPSTFRQHGADALFVVSTSIGISILGASAYQRYVLVHPEAPALDALPPGAVYLPSGLIQGGRARLDGLALVATSTSNALSPCRQLYAHRLLTTYDLNDYDDHKVCMPNSKIPVDCPCKNGDRFCGVPAMLELTPPGGIDVLVVDDTDQTLQALRTELRPDQSEVDGILGTNVLRGAEIDVDYPHDRLLARCRGGNCLARPQLALTSDRCQINRCITGSKEARDCPTSDCPPDHPDRCSLLRPL
jgi:hypothetical protein